MPTVIGIGQLGEQAEILNHPLTLIVRKNFNSGCAECLLQAEEHNQKINGSAHSAFNTLHSGTALSLLFFLVMFSLDCSGGAATD
jgi:hypothetical protein